MQEHDASGSWPTHANLIRDLVHLRWHLLVVCLVREVLHTIAAFGVIANRTREQHDSTAIGTHRPLICISDWQTLRGETHPRVALRWCMHRAHRSRERGDIHWSALFTTMPNVERGDWQNDPEYPKAPLPAHERSWRHPSEIGASQWAISEPPLVVGRGLSVATGTVGAALAVGLLWLMIPHHNRSGVSASGSVTTIRQSTDIANNAFISTVGHTNSADTSTANSTNATVLGADPTNTISTVSSTSVSNTMPHGPTPMPTLLIGATNSASSRPATAMALTPGHFVVTTAQALNGRQGVEVVLPSGETVIGAVVFVDKLSGAAVLAVPTEIDASVIEVSPDQSHMTAAVMMSPEPLTVNVVADDTGVRLTYDGDGTPGEGSIVLDQQGRLLGMCTLSSSGAKLVSVDAMLKALDSAATVSVPAWLGIRPDKTTGGNVVVGSVVIDGPAQVGGIRAGDIIEAIDGIPVASLDELGQVIATHAAGDSVVVRLARAGETAPVVIRITFSSHPDSM